MGSGAFRSASWDILDLPAMSSLTSRRNPAAVSWSLHAKLVFGFSADDPGRQGQRTAHAGGRSRARPCSARVLQLSAPKRVPGHACGDGPSEQTSCHHPHGAGPCWLHHRQLRVPKPAPRDTCHNGQRPCCRYFQIPAKHPRACPPHQARWSEVHSLVSDALPAAALAVAASDDA